MAFKKEITLLVIAGEPSGDLIAAPVLRELKKQAPFPLSFVGIGGEKMQSEGMQPLFPMEKLTTLGFSGALKKVKDFYKAYRIIQSAAQRLKPDLLLTIDFPGVNFFLGRRLKKRGIPHVHYVAPTVWAWKAYRARRMAKFLDHLLVLFSFEPPYFTRHGLPTTFVGHPLWEIPYEDASASDFRRTYTIPPQAPLLALLPGSRPSELRRHLLIFRDTVELLKVRFPSLWIVIPTLPSLEDYLKENWLSSLPTVFVTQEQDKRNAYQASTAALVASGTATLELALAGVPMVVTYKVSTLSGLLIRSLIKIRFVSLVNILLRKKVVPELLQNDCTPQRLSRELSRLMGSPEARSGQRKNFSLLRPLLVSGQKPPSVAAAQVILNFLRDQPTQSKEP